MSESRSLLTAGPRPIVVGQVVLGLRIGGLERVVVDLVNHSAPDLGSAVVCLEERGPLADEIRAPGTTVTTLGRRKGLSPWLLFRLWQTLRSAGVAVVHTHNTAAGFYGALASRLAGLPVVHTKHGLSSDRIVPQDWLDRFAFRLTDHVVAVSAATRRLARDQGVPEDRLCVIDNGIDTSSFGAEPAERRAAREALGVPAEAVVVGCVARLTHEKNHLLLLEAFARLAGDSAGTGAWLVLVGGGPLERVLRDKAASYPVADRIRFAGNRRDVRALLPAFDVFALASKSEGLPIALLEAMATGIAPLVTRVGAMPDVVAGGDAGRVVEPGDLPAFESALRALTLDPALRSRLGAAARARVRDRYDARRMALDYRAVYEQVLGRRSRAGSPDRAPGAAV